MSSKYGSLFEKRANSPLRGQHPKLYGGYLDAQCDEFGATKWTDLDNDLGMALGFKYPWERTQYDLDALRDCVAMMRGLGAAWLRLGKAARFSLNRDAYLPLDSPQHSGDPRDTYARIRRTQGAPGRLRLHRLCPRREEHGQGNDRLADRQGLGVGQQAGRPHRAGRDETTAAGADRAARQEEAAH